MAQIAPCQFHIEIAEILIDLPWIIVVLCKGRREYFENF